LLRQHVVAGGATDQDCVACITEEGAGPRPGNEEVAAITTLENVAAVADQDVVTGTSAAGDICVDVGAAAEEGVFRIA
jgi:hypothetical protein